MPYSGVKGWQSYRFITIIVCRDNQSINLAPTTEYYSDLIFHIKLSRALFIFSDYFRSVVFCLALFII